jgi:hypothetical protein
MAEPEYPPLKIAELTVDEATAHEFVKTADNVHHFKIGQWKDLRFDILI